MIIDNDLVLAEDLSVSASAEGTKVIDCGQDLLTTGLNNDQKLGLVTVATGDFAGDGATVAVNLLHSDEEAGTYTVCASSAPVDAATFSVKPIIVPMPYEHKRYLKVSYTVSGTLSSSGTVMSFISDSKDLQQAYAEEDGSFQ